MTENRLPTYTDTRTDIEAQEHEVEQTQNQAQLQLQNLIDLPIAWAGPISHEVGRGRGFLLAYMNLAKKVGEALGCGETFSQVAALAGGYVGFSMLEFLLGWGKTVLGGCIALLLVRKAWRKYTEWQEREGSRS